MSHVVQVRFRLLGVSSLLLSLAFMMRCVVVWAVSRISLSEVRFVLFRAISIGEVGKICQNELKLRR